MSATTHNLPPQATAFVGREEELARARRLLADFRLVTVIGTGGVGKTRLAIETGARSVNDYAGGAWFVGLSGVISSALAPQAVADALGFGEAGAATLQEQILDYLRARNLLLILDHCEGQVDPCAALAEGILAGCPDVRILATSRVPLAVPGEVTWLLPGLGLPVLEVDDVGPLAPAALVRTSDAVRLFVDRTKAARPDFELTESNVAAVVRTCRGLGGIPLALELVAAAGGDLHDSQLTIERITDAEQGSRFAGPDRETALEMVLCWAHDLLDEPEQRLLRRLSVLVGGCTADGVDAVWPPDEPWMDVGACLRRLVERSFALAKPHGDEMRYHLASAVRDFAARRLAESAEADAIHQRHSEWSQRFAELAVEHLNGPEQSVWLARLEAEHDNLRAALEWCLCSGKAEDAANTAESLASFWIARGHFSEGRRWLERILDALPFAATDARTRALCKAGLLAWFQGDHDQAAALAGESMDLARRSRDRTVYGRSLQTLGIQAMQQGQYEHAEDLLTKSLAIFRDDPPMYIISLDALANLALTRGYHGRAESLFTQSLTLAREQGDQRTIAYALMDLGAVARLQGDIALAHTDFSESLRLAQELGEQRLEGAVLIALGDVAALQGRLTEAVALAVQGLDRMLEIGDRYGTAVALESMASTLLRLDRPEPATRLLGAADALRDEIRAPVNATERRDREETISGCRAALRLAAFGSAWQEGRGLAASEALALARELAAEPAT